MTREGWELDFGVFPPLDPPPLAKPFHDTVRHMNKRALLYAGFLTAAVAVLLTSGRLHRALSDGTARVFANNK